MALSAPCFVSTLYYETVCVILPALGLPLAPVKETLEACMPYLETSTFFGIPQGDVRKSPETSRWFYACNTHTHTHTHTHTYIHIHTYTHRVEIPFYAGRDSCSTFGRPQPKRVWLTHSKVWVCVCACVCVWERACFYYIIIQTYEVGLHSRRRPIEIDAGTRPFASFDAPIS